MIWSDSFLKFGSISSHMSVNDVPGYFCILILMSAFLFNPFPWTPFNIESPNNSRRISFLLFVFGFTSLDSVLFGELFALFLSAYSLIFLVLLKLSFSSDLLAAMSDLVLMSFWRCSNFFFSSSFVWSSNLCIMLFFDSNSELVRLLSDFKNWSFILPFVFNSFYKWSIFLLCLTDDVCTSSSHLDLEMVNSLSNISLMLFRRFCRMFPLKLSTLIFHIVSSCLCLFFLKN